MFILNEKYEDDNFYMLQHEYHKLLKSFIFHENKYISPSKIFTHKGKKFECVQYSLTLRSQEFEYTNRLIAFHDFYRDENDGEIKVFATPIL